MSITAGDNTIDCQSIGSGRATSRNGRRSGTWSGFFGVSWMAWQLTRSTLAIVAFGARPLAGRGQDHQSRIIGPDRWATLRRMCWRAASGLAARTSPWEARRAAARVLPSNDGGQSIMW